MPPSKLGKSYPRDTAKNRAKKPGKTATKAKPADANPPRKRDKAKAVAMAEAVRSVMEKTQNGTVGRPTDYLPEYATLAEKMCQLNIGITDKDLADFFEVDERTINYWKSSQPEFFQSIRAGKTISDFEVANALYRKAVGATYIEEKEVKRKEVEYDKVTGKKIREEEFIEVVPLIKQAPPDAVAGKYWLNNRQPDRWKEKVEVTAPPDAGFTPSEALTLGFARRLAFMLEKGARIAAAKDVTVDTVATPVTD